MDNRVLTIFGIFVSILVLFLSGVGGCSNSEKEKTAIPAPKKNDPVAAGTITGFTFSRTIKGKKEFDVKAKKAIYYEGENRARFEDAQIIFFAQDGQQIRLTSEEGTVQTDSNDISASGNVKIVSDNGYSLKTTSLSYKADEKLIFTDEPILLLSQGMTLNGAGLKLWVEGEKLEIQGLVKGTIQR